MTLRERFRKAFTQPHWKEHYQGRPTGRVLAGLNDLITDAMTAVDEKLAETGNEDLRKLIRDEREGNA